MSLPMIKATYIARAVASFFGRADNENIQAGVQMRVEEGEHAGSGLAWIGHFTDKTTDRTIESFQRMGWNGDDLFELYELDAEGCAQLLPELVEIVVEPEADLEGVMRLKVRWVNKIGAGQLKFKKPLEAHDMKAFAAQMRGQVRGAGARIQAAKHAQLTPPAQRSLPAQTRSGPPPGVQAHPNAPGFDRGEPRHDDDIPF